MIFGSVCSGIEAASVAWEPLGWKAAWFAEVDRAASEVLAYRFPNVVNHGDMTLLADKVRRREIIAPDILVGGTPCQAFSVAGMRKGLDDARGQLTISFFQLADAIDEIRAADGLPPCIIVWENVPGVLSDKTNAFGCFLAGLAGESDALVPAGRKWTNAGAVLGPQRAIAWRVQDAQYHGLAQRRRRVFAISSARQGFDPAAILLEFDGVRRDSAPSRETGQSVAGILDARTDGGGFPGTDGACAGHVQPVRRSAGLTEDGFAVAVCPTLRAGGNSTGGDRPPGTDADTADSLIVQPVTAAAAVPTWWDGRDVSQTLDAVLHKGQTMPEKNRFPAVLQPIHVVHGTQDPCTSETTAFALGRNSGGENVIAFTSKDFGGDATTDLSPTLRASGHGETHANGGSPPAVAYAVSLRGREGGGTAELGDDLATCLRASGGGGDKPHVLASLAFVQNSRDEVRLMGGDGQIAGALSVESGTHQTTYLATVLPFDTTQITSPSNYSSPRDGDPCHPLAAGADPPAVCVTGEITHTLKAEGFDASEDGTGRGQPIVAFDTYNQAVSDVTHTLRNPNGTFGDALPATFNGMAVRRLLPVECERLQGFPDSWTRVPVGKHKDGSIKWAADGPRYKQCGNSMAVNCMRWIGSRIQRWLDNNPTPIGHNGGPSMFDDILGGSDGPVAVDAYAELLG